ncbi:MAG TPA: hypothetical protein VLB29_13680, partial [Nocardioidaceae bacterium]|nr:hypothetical protein [Nocardioidaceae bacterium]
TLRFGRNTEFAASWDPRAFTYLADRRTLLATLGNWNGPDRVVVLRVGEDGTLTRRAGHDVPGWAPEKVRALPLPEGRVALVAGGTVKLLES